MTGAGSLTTESRQSADLAPDLPAIRRITPREQGDWHWFATVLVTIIVVTEIPFALAYHQAANGVAFRGLFWLPYDVPQYLAAMREGATSNSWLTHDHLTGETHHPALMYVLYVALGKVSALFGWRISVVFHFSQLLARVITLMTIYQFSSAYFSDVRRRRMAFLLTLCGTGMVIGAPKYGMTMFLAGEVNVFSLLFASPHLLLGLSALLLALRWYLASWTQPHWRYTPLCALAVLGIALDNSFSVVTLGAVVGTFLLVMVARTRAVPRAARASAGAMAFIAVPFVIYSVLTFNRDPFWGIVYGRQNVTLTPPLPLLLLCIAPLVALALFGFRSWVQDFTAPRVLLLVWVVVTIALMYLPMGVQYRFGMGLPVPLGIIGAVGFNNGWDVLRRWHSSAAIVVRAALLPIVAACGAVIFLSPAIWWAFVVRLATLPVADLRRSTSFEPASVVQAGRWLSTVEGPDDVTLALPLTGNELAGAIPGRVFVGHGVATLDFPAKAMEAQWFYQGAGALQDRASFLATNHIRYVFYGPEEAHVAGATLPSDPTLRVVYHTAKVTIFQVVGLGDPATAAPPSPAS